MGRARQTFERRQLGLTLRRLREQADLTQQAAADAIGRVRSRIVELEEGKGTLSQQDLTNLLDYYGVTGAHRKTVLALGAQARRRQRGGLHTDILPGSFQRFADLEASATEISGFESGVIPGLLQSADYVHALIKDGDGAWWDSSESEVTERVAFRRARQERVWNSAENRRVRFVIPEDVLHIPVGGTAVMRLQARHLQHLMDHHPSLTIQVLSSDTTSNPARGGGFVVFGFDGSAPLIGHSSVIFGPSAYVDDEVDTGRLVRVFDRLSTLAMTPVESRRVIDEIAETK